ncbi:hypothetical protein ACFE04_019630 [Oxalis oulophora]
MFDRRFGRYIHDVFSLSFFLQPGTRFAGPPDPLLAKGGVGAYAGWKMSLVSPGNSFRLRGTLGANYVTPPTYLRIADITGSFLVRERLGDLPEMRDIVLEFAQSGKNYNASESEAELFPEDEEAYF